MTMSPRLITWPNGANAASDRGSARTCCTFVTEANLRDWPPGHLLFSCSSPGARSVPGVETLGERRVRLETCQNFRDLGGYRTVDGPTVAWGRPYRADTLHRLSASDLEAIVGLAIRTVVDLRAHDEIERHGRLAAHGHEIEYHHLPMLDEVMGRDRSADPAPRELPDDLGGFYIQMLEGATSAITSALSILAAPDALPAVFHCMAGKDRTGILAAVILGGLGVADQDIVEDYVLTERCRAERDAFLAEHDPDYLAYLDSLPPFAREARPESMWAFLRHVCDRYGSMALFLDSVGVGPVVIDALRNSLLEA